MPVVNRADLRFNRIVRAASLVAVILIVLIAGVMFVNSRPALNEYGLGLFTGTLWDVPNARFGSLSFIYGTVMTSLIALLLGRAVPADGCPLVVPSQPDASR